ncbi:MAG: hypothetical protein E7282_11340 [Lachnospiraceae bacterium]|nr:hypothetical protein [Lachnospiraceae bacterium]
MNKAFKLIRILTIAPICAIGLIIITFLQNPSMYSSPLQLLYSLVFLGVFPVLAYPIQHIIPRYKNEGRNGQRELAMIFAFAGYVLGGIYNFAFFSSSELWMIYLSYIICGMLIFVFNKAFSWKVSGHACGVAAPCIMLICFRLPYPAIFYALLLVLVFISSIRLQRHTIMQLAGGVIIACIVCVTLKFILL